jgi:hypothetical protein
VVTQNHKQKPKYEPSYVKQLIPDGQGVIVPLSLHKSTQRKALVNGTHLDGVVPVGDGVQSTLPSRS